jgi:hypothetical protein
MQASVVCQIRGGGERGEEIAVWDGQDDQETGFFFLYEVSASGFSCGEQESGCGDDLDGEKKKTEKMTVSGDDDSAPWTENGYVGGLGEVNDLPGLCDASQSDWTLR